MSTPVFAASLSVQLNKSRAFSLLELLLALNILALLFMLALPAMQQWLDRQQAESYVRQLRQQLNFARVSAVSSGQRTVQVCPLAGAQCLDQWWQLPIQIRLQQRPARSCSVTHPATADQLALAVLQQRAIAISCRRQSECLAKWYFYLLC